MHNRIFAIIKISYSSGSIAIVGGICGTCFFVGKNKFITAEHCFNESIFIPHSGLKFCKVFLVNKTGKIINNPKIFKTDKNFDLSIGAVRNKVGFYKKEDFAIGGYSPGDKVFNIGFPVSESIRGFTLSLKRGKLFPDSFKVSSIKQEGVIDEIKNETYDSQADIVKLKDKKLIIVSYTSRMGFSGAPLFHKKSNKIIGFLSLLPHNNSDPVEKRIRDVKNRVRAMTFEEVKNLI